MSGATLVFVGSCLGASLFALCRFGPSPLRLPAWLLFAAVFVAVSLGAVVERLVDAERIGLASVRLAASLAVAPICWVMAIRWARIRTRWPARPVVPERIGWVALGALFLVSITNPIHGAFIELSNGVWVRHSGFDLLVATGYVIFASTAALAIWANRHGPFSGPAMLFCLHAFQVGVVYAIERSGPGLASYQGVSVAQASAATLILLGAWIDVGRQRHASELERRVDDQTQELRTANRNLREAHERMIRAERVGVGEELAGSVAHAVNNPLTALIGSLQLTLETLETGSEQDIKRVERSLSMAYRIRDVVDRTLELFRKGSLRLSPTDAQSVMDDAIEQIRPGAARAGVEIHVSCQRPSPGLIVDSALLAEALACLMMNSIQAMPNGGLLRVEAERDDPDQLTRFRVIDTGPGISEELKPRIFEPFFTARSAGTGLGLPIAHGIAQGHGGRIFLDETGSGGACMVVEIPQSWSAGPNWADAEAPQRT